MTAVSTHKEYFFSSSSYLSQKQKQKNLPHKPDRTQQERKKQTNAGFFLWYVLQSSHGSMKSADMPDAHKVGACASHNKRQFVRFVYRSGCTACLRSPVPPHPALSLPPPLTSRRWRRYSGKVSGRTSFSGSASLRRRRDECGCLYITAQCLFFLSSFFGRVKNDVCFFTVGVQEDDAKRGHLRRREAGGKK